MKWHLSFNIKMKYEGVMSISPTCGLMSMQKRIFIILEYVSCEQWFIGRFDGWYYFKLFLCSSHSITACVVAI